MPGPDRLVVVDSEVDEPTGAGVPDPVSNNVNIWFTQPGFQECLQFETWQTKKSKVSVTRWEQNPPTSRR